MFKPEMKNFQSQLFPSSPALPPSGEGSRPLSQRERVRVRAKAALKPKRIHKSQRISIFLLSSFILYLSSFTLALAQSSAYAEIGPPDVSAFPNISTVLDVYDSNGQFVSGLKPTDLNIVEDGKPLPAQTLSEEPIGAQIVVGVNPGPSFDVRDGEGVSRYQRIQQNLGAWVTSLPKDTHDDLSLVTIAGPIIAHTNTQSWLASFAAYQPNFKATTPNIQPLAFAVDAALTSNAQVGTKRAVLFITPHMDDPSLEEALMNIGGRAVAGRVRIFVWFVDTDAFFNHASAVLFQALAEETGGAYATFNGLSSLPNPENYFAPLRSVYHLTYASGLTTAGDHTLSVEATLGDNMRVASAEQNFTLDIQPPNPIFAGLDAEITRAAPVNDPYNDQVLVPTEKALTVIFDFPDGRQRAIVSTALYVDGQLVAENKTGALDQFTWDLSAYTESGQHTLRVSATDELGITGSSLDLPVDIKVTHPESGPLIWLARSRQAIVYGALALAGLILFGTLLGSRLRRLPSARERKAAREKYNDPLTQPIRIAGAEPPTGPSKKPRQGKPLEAGKDAPARLVRLGVDGQPVTSNPIPLIESETTLGTDPVQATYILDEPALSPLHARILRNETGFSIADQNSLSGTWVNYKQVTRAGHALKHGDRVHFGNLMYRFELKDPPPTSEPTVTPAEPG